MFVNIVQGSTWQVASSEYTLAVINYYSVMIALIIIITLSLLWATSEETFGAKVGLRKP